MSSRLLVSDIAMPDENGYDLIRKVRARDADRGGRIPALAVTAYARIEDRAAAIAAGYQQHAAKPIEPAELAAAVATVGAPKASAVMEFSTRTSEAAAAVPSCEPTNPEKQP